MCIFFLNFLNNVLQSLLTKHIDCIKCNKLSGEDLKYRGDGICIGFSQILCHFM